MMASGKALLALPLLMACLALLGQCAMLRNTEEDGGDDQDLITTTCKHTLHFQVCISSLRSDPHSHTVSDLKGLAVIALNLSLAHAAKTLSSVHELMNNDTNHGKYMTSCLSDCLEEYSEAFENLKDSEEALGDGDYGKVETLVSAAMTDVET